MFRSSLVWSIYPSVCMGHLSNITSCVLSFRHNMLQLLYASAQRPQSLGVHLATIASSGNPGKIAYVGWTGMASASSLAQWNSGRAEGALETVEIDPQFGAALGFAEGAVVRRPLEMHNILVLSTLFRSRLDCCITFLRRNLSRQNRSLRMTGKYWYSFRRTAL